MCATITSQRIALKIMFVCHSRWWFVSKLLNNQAVIWNWH